LNNRKKSLDFGTAVVVMSLATLTACSSASDTASSATPGPTRTYSADVPAVDPNDPYNLYLADDLLQINSSLTELQFKCFAQNGYPEFLDVLPAQKADDFRTLAETPDFRSTFSSYAELPWQVSSDAAKRHGFGRDVLPIVRSVVVKDTAFPVVQQNCRTEALAAASGNQGLIQQYVSLGNTLASALVVADDKYRPSFNDKVFKCMGEKGSPVDKGGPNVHPVWQVDFQVPLGSVTEPPFPNLKGGGNTVINPGRPGVAYMPTAEESRAAETMYRCSVDSGAKSDWENAMNEAKKTALSTQEAQISELNPAIKQLAKSAAAATQAG